MRHRLYRRNREDDERRSDDDLRTKIGSALQKLETPTVFAFSAVPSSLPNPGLYLPQYGVLGLPLSTDDAKRIISLASSSPFGKGEETVIDPSVRKSWELNPTQFALKNSEWNKAMQVVAETVSTELGIKNAIGEVTAELHKLLLYEPEAFFKPHRDSEKVPGMFATLAVCLPSPHEGGKLVMTHRNEKYEFETAPSSHFSTSYAAWYADIMHEVLPVTSGYRLMLIYNLILETYFVTPSYDMVCERMQQLTTQLEQYNSQLEEEDNKLPPFLLHKLKHKYTQANLKLKFLKPQDLAQVQTLKKLSAKLGFDLYLAILELTVATDEENYDFEERQQNILNIVELDGKLITTFLHCSKGVLIDPSPQDTREADKVEREGPTGNEGSPVAHWYHDAVVILVPPARKMDFIFKFGSNGKVTEPLFCQLMQECLKDPAQRPKLEQLCERALKPERLFPRKFSHSFPQYIQEAAATALDLGRIDLFDEACKMTDSKIMLDNAHSLGRWAANSDVTTVQDRLKKGVQIASTDVKKLEFLKLFAEGFKTAVQESDQIATYSHSKLENDKPAHERLEEYLKPYYNIIMSADVEGFSDLQSIVSKPESSETTENAASAHSSPPNQSDLKRGASFSEDEPAKRSKSEED